MTHPYRLLDETEIATPALVFYPALIRRNVARVVELAGSPDRLRPHAKTHKTREITRMQLDSGVTKHKCATIAEAEMLADTGVPDVLIAYQMLGPNLGRLAALVRKFPNTQFSCSIDHASASEGLSQAAHQAGRSIGFLVDLDVGQHRTGIAIGDVAADLYSLSSELPGLTPYGLHAYDGHLRQAAPSEREAAARSGLNAVLQLRAELLRRGNAVPRIVAGGTPTFPIYAKMHDIPGLECSPGTYVLHDYNYGSTYTDLTGITPAALLMTRVVSRPTADRVTFDLGSKSVSPDMPLPQRAHLLDLPDATFVAQNEEHLVVTTPAAGRLKLGDVLYAIPGHVCPSVALYREALTAENGQITGRWKIAARDRKLTV